MKTDKFEKTIRRKLESIEPEFHEDDWTKMQNYMNAHTPPTFWQQYSSWFGYAAAAAVTSVMVFLYVNQLSQNNTLLSDVRTLKNQIEVIKNTPAVVQKTDTVYIVQHEKAAKPSYDKPAYHQQEQDVTQPFGTQELLADQDAVQEIREENNTDPVLNPDAEKDNKEIESSSLNKSSDILAGNSKRDHNEITEPDAGLSPEKAVSNPVNNKIPRNIELNTSIANNSRSEITGNNNDPGVNTKGSFGSGNIRNNSGSNRSGNTGNRSGNWGANNSDGNNQNNIPVTSQKTLDEKFDQLAVQSPVKKINYTAVSRRMNYGLVHRMAPKQVKNVLLAANTPKIPETAKSTESTKKAESVKKAETAIPKLNLKVPYRFGVAQQWEGKNQVRTVLGEVLVSKNFSVSTGVSWVKIKPADFHSEKMYNDRTRRDFKRDHFLPMALKIVNMNIQSSLIQIPLNVAFRSNLKNNFAYFIGAGTNFTVQSKREIAYDCYFSLPNPGPKPGANEAYFRERTSEKMDLKLVNSVNFSAGIEKSWHPLVVQAEGYLYSYFTPLSPQASRSGPGFKIKLLYQIGKKM